MERTTDEYIKMSKPEMLIEEIKQLKEVKYNQGITMGNQFDLLVEYKQKLEKISSLEYNFRNPDISLGEFIKRLKEILGDK